MKNKIIISMIASSYLLMGESSSLLGEIKEVRSELNQVKVEQKELIEKISLDDIYASHSNSSSMMLLKRWIEITQEGHYEVSRFIHDTKEWVEYTLMESLRFELSSGELDRVKAVVADITMTTSSPIYETESSKYVTIQDLNLRLAPMVATSTQNIVISKGTIVRVYYTMKFEHDFVVSQWAYVETDNDYKGWVNARYMHPLQRS